MIRIFKYLSILLILSVSDFSLAQNDNAIQKAKTDSLLNQLNAAKSDTLKYRLLIQLAKRAASEPINIMHVESALKIAEKLNSNEKVGNCYNLFAIHYFDQNKFSEGFNWVEKTNQLAIKTRDTSLILLGLTGRETLYRKLGQLENCFDILEKKEKIYHLQNNKLEEAECLYIQGYTGFNAKLYSKSLIALHKSLRLFTDLNKPVKIRTVMGWLGITHNGLKNYDSALYYRNYVIDNLGAKPRPAEKGNAYRYSGDVYYAMRNYEKALEYYKISYESHKLVKRNAGDVLMKTYIIKTLFSMGNYTEAAKELDFLLDSVFTNPEIRKSKTYAWSLANAQGRFAYQKTGQYDKAIRCFLITDSLKQAEAELGKDTVVQRQILMSDFKKDQETREAIIQAEFSKKQALAKSDIEKKKLLLDRSRQEYILLEQENQLKEMSLSQSQLELKQKQTESEGNLRKVDLLYKDKVIQKAAIQKQKLLIYSFAAGGILILSLLFFVVKGYWQKKKDNLLINRQKQLVEIKQKEIVDSITYAKRLQEAILPAELFWKSNLEDSFVLYKPKDIVAGDFYWMEVVKSKIDASEKILFAAADCTGHGVPGAMVSVVCSNALNRSVLEFGITEPGEVLDKTRELVIGTFEKSDKEVKDGMDISLCCFNKTTRELSWAGANNSLLYFQNGEMKKIKADKQPVGKYINQKNFVTHKIQLNKGDYLFLYTDGYADQFGGSKGKKFMQKKLEELLLDNIKHPLHQQRENMLNTFDKWTGECGQVDDVCVIGVRV